jgi:hypothetical protein
MLMLLVNEINHSKVQGRVMLKIRVVKAMLRVTAAAAISLLVALRAANKTLEVAVGR